MGSARRWRIIIMAFLSDGIFSKLYKYSTLDYEKQQRKLSDSFRATLLFLLWLDVLYAKCCRARWKYIACICACIPGFARAEMPPSVHVHGPLRDLVIQLLAASKKNKTCTLFCSEIGHCLAILNHEQESCSPSKGRSTTGRRMSVSWMEPRLP